MFVDIFDFYDFDLKASAGRAIITKLNGSNAQYAAELKDGDEITLGWQELFRLKDNEKENETEMELCSIASGSSGNCLCVGTDNCHLLIDAGVSGKRIEAGLNSVGLKTEEMQGILVTHEHIRSYTGAWCAGKEIRAADVCDSGNDRGDFAHKVSRENRRGAVS